MSDEEFERRTLSAIEREFGLGGVARFVMAYRFGTGDYTRDRHLWQDGLKMGDVLADTKKLSDLPG